MIAFGFEHKKDVSTAKISSVTKEDQAWHFGTTNPFILSFRILIISIMATNLHPVATVAALELVWPSEDQASHWQRNTSKYSSTLSDKMTEAGM